MTFVGSIGLMIVGMLVILVGSLGSMAIHDVAWHELKEYSLRRNRRALFDAVHDDHNEVIVGLDTLKTIGFVVVAIATAFALSAASGTGPLWWAPTIAIAIPTLIGCLAVAVWIPTAVAHVWGTLVLYHWWRIFRGASWLVWPLVLFARLMESMFRRMAGETEEQDEEEAFEDEILAMVTEGLHDGHLEADAREMIEGVIELGDADVADIMTPRSKMDALSIDSDWGEMLRMVAQLGRTRLPVYQGQLDNVIGVLYVKDLMAELAKSLPESHRPLRDSLCEAWSVPLSQPLDELLQDFLQSRNHLAIVVDEYMGVAGLVTIEDVLEEIVGEIVDESDKEQVGEIHRIDRNKAEIHGRAHLAEVNEQLGLALPEPEDFDTIAGFVIHQMGKIPRTGETLEWGNIRITVVKATERKIERVQLDSLAPLVQHSSS